MRILHIITSLDTGGAEIMLHKLLSATHRNHAEAVLCLKHEGGIAQRIKELGVPVYSLGLRPKIPNPALVFKIRTLVRRLQPDLMQGWMTHANLVSNLAAIWSRHPVPVLWNIQMSLYDLKSDPWYTATAIRFAARLSNRPEFIIYNSRISAQQHVDLGYCAAKTVVIPTGFDCDLFRPDREVRLSVRKELGLTDGVVLVGLVARYHPMKDHAGFLKSAQMICEKNSQARFVLIGKGLTPDQPEIRKLIAEYNLQERVLLLGERADLPRLTAALDIACSSSAWGEGFSNAVGEAMACAVPCVVTDVGDSAYAVGETGLSVPPSDPQALAQAIGGLIDAGHEYRQQLGRAARERIQSEFSLSSIAQRYQALYGKVLEDGIRDVHT